jgi:putative salt-induced outer membrane protein YdiY
MALFLAVVVASSARAQGDEKELGWQFEVELSGIWTAGNSESNTFGLESVLRRVWEKSLFRVRAGGTQTQSTLVTRTALGTTSDFTVQKTENTEKTAELFFARAFYEYDFSKRFFAFGGVDWLRNQFAGIDSRFLLVGGAGNTWTDRDKLKFKTFYSVTYTFEEEVVNNPFTNSNFPGARLAYEFFARLSASTSFTSDLILDFNLDNTDDVRADFTNALPIAISEKLFFKPSWQLLWRNDPALTQVPLVDANGVPTGETVPAPLEKTDSLFSMSLVVRL